MGNNMKIVFYSDHGDVMGIARKCAAEGSDVSVYIHDRQAAKRIYDYRIKPLKTLSEIVASSPDFVVFDSLAHREDSGKLRLYGIRTLFQGTVADSITSRDSLMLIGANSGMVPCRRLKFSNVNSAVVNLAGKYSAYEFVPGNPDLMQYAYNSSSGTEMAEYLLLLRNSSVSDSVFAGGLELREIERGVEVITEVWFMGGKPVFPAVSYLETRRSHAGDVGVLTESQTTFMWPYRKKEPRLVQEHKKIWPLMEKLEYTGPWGMTSLVDEKSIELIDFREGLSFNAFYSFCGLLKISVSSFLYNLSRGIQPREHIHEVLGYAVNVFCPDHPVPRYTPVHLPRDTEGLWFRDTFVSEDSVLANNQGTPVTVTSTGVSPYALESMINARLKKLSMPNKHYRFDGVRAVRRGYDLLNEWGCLD